MSSSLGNLMLRQWLATKHANEARSMQNAEAARAHSLTLTDKAQRAAQQERQELDRALAAQFQEEAKIAELYGKLAEASGRDVPKFGKERLQERADLGALSEEVARNRRGEEQLHEMLLEGHKYRRAVDPVKMRHLSNLDEMAREHKYKTDKRKADAKHDMDLATHKANEWARSRKAVLDHRKAQGLNAGGSSAKEVEYGSKAAKQLWQNTFALPESLLGSPQQGILSQERNDAIYALKGLVAKYANHAVMQGDTQASFRLYEQLIQDPKLHKILKEQGVGVDTFLSAMQDIHTEALHTASRPKTSPTQQTPHVDKDFEDSSSDIEALDDVYTDMTDDDAEAFQSILP